jgi:hypothetical protein
MFCSYSTPKNGCLYSGVPADWTSRWLENGIKWECGANQANDRGAVFAVATDWTVGKLLTFVPMSDPWEASAVESRIRTGPTIS